MNTVLLSNLRPIICTLQEARAILLPVTEGYTWGETTIKDLWTRCAPTPDSTIGSSGEKRIINPEHLGAWLADVLEKKGRPVSDAAGLYLRFIGDKNAR